MLSLTERTEFTEHFKTHVDSLGVLSLTKNIFSLTELTDLTESFAHRFELTEGLRHTENTEASPPAPLRMERGVVCEVTPFGLLLIGNGPLNIWRTYRGISVITPLSIRRGAGGEAGTVGVTSVITPLSTRRGAGGEVSITPSTT